MSELSASMSDLRKRLKSSGVPTVKVEEKTLPIKRTIGSTASGAGTQKLASVTSSSGSNISPLKKMKLDDVSSRYSLISSAAENSATHLSTNLHFAVETIKKYGRPITLEALKKEVTVNIDERLFKALVKTDRIKYNEDKETFEYVSTHNIRSANSLMEALNSQHIFKGILVKDLKDGWPNCNATLNDLEKKNKILILRAKKDNSPRCVWINYRELALGAIDTEFVNMWNMVKLPSINDLPMKLNERGIKPTSIDPSSLKKTNAVRSSRKQKKPRKGRITNTHMKGILRDYT